MITPQDKPVIIVTQKQLRTVQYLFKPPHIIIILRLTPPPPSNPLFEKSCRTEYGKYFLGEVASRVGTGERWTGTPLVQPSLRHTLQVGVEENLRYSRKKFKFVLLLNFNNRVFHSAKLCPLC